MPGAVRPELTAAGFCRSSMAAGHGFHSLAAGISGRANAGRRLGRSLRDRSFCFSPTDHLFTDGAGTWWVSGAEEWWWQDGRAGWGAVRSGPEECRTVWGSAKRFLVVTGGPVWRVARAEPTCNDRSGTRNATARGRHGA